MPEFSGDSTKENGSDSESVRNPSLRVAVITSLLRGRRGQDERLLRFVHTLEGAGAQGVIISGFRVFEDRDLDLLHRKVQGNKPGPLILALLHVPLSEIGSTMKLTQRLGRVDILLFYLGAPAVLPLMIGKLFGKRSLFVVTGMEAREIRQKQRNALIRGLLATASGGYRTICFHLVDRLGVQSPNVIETHGLGKYRHKVRIFGARYVDTSAFRIQQPFGQRENLIGYIGRLSREKGVLNFVDAMPLILAREERIRFFVIGDGVLRKTIEKRIRERSLEDRVTLAGWVPHEEIPQWLNRLRLVVSPSYTEGLPPLIQEAMACGTPVLATPVGGIPDLINDGETGFLLEDNSPERIARRVIEVLNDPRLPEISNRASAFIREHFSRERITEQWREALEELSARPVRK